MDRSSIYLNALPLFTSGRARLLDNPRLIAQFAALERRTFSTGRDRVDKGRTGHDDAANSAAGALVLAARAALQISEPAIVSPCIIPGRPWNWPSAYHVDTGAGAGIANTPPPKGYDRPSSAELWFPYVDKW
jgi:hypothetical protein